MSCIIKLFEWVIEQKLRSYLEARGGGGGGEGNLHTEMCHYFGYFFWGAPGVFGIFLIVPGFLGIIFW